VPKETKHTILKTYIQEIIIDKIEEINKINTNASKNKHHARLVR
jgi:hypothetical protein